MQAKHRYRVSIYLGKDNYEQIKKLADFINLPVGTMARIMLETGLQISKQFEKGDQPNGSEQP